MNEDCIKHLLEVLKKLEKEMETSLVSPKVRGVISYITGYLGGALIAEQSKNKKKKGK